MNAEKQGGDFLDWLDKGVLTYPGISKEAAKILALRGIAPPSKYSQPGKQSLKELQDSIPVMRMNGNSGVADELSRFINTHRQSVSRQISS